MKLKKKAYKTLKYIDINILYLTIQSKRLTKAYLKIKALYNYLKVFKIRKMELISFFSATFIACTLISITIYSIYTGFGPNSKNLRDPFEEHEE